MIKKALIWIKALIKSVFNIKRNLSLWEYGTCNNRRARRHKINKNVQFVLWKAGEQGHDKDYWHNFDSSWWVGFTTDTDEQIKEQELKMTRFHSPKDRVITHRGFHCNKCGKRF